MDSLLRYLLFGLVAGALAGVVSVFFQLNPALVGGIFAFFAALAAGIGIGMGTPLKT
jgi:hypothetical protein